MSTTTLPIDPVGQERFHLIANLLPESDVASLPKHIITQLEEAGDYLEFSGRLVIPVQSFSIPEQDFSASFNDFGAIFESKPAGLWPSIFIEFSSDSPLGKSKAKEFFDPLTSLKIKSFLLRPSDNTVDAWVLHTRVMHCLYKNGECSLYATSIGKRFGFKFDPISRLEEQQFLDRAKLCRKLKFIQNVFRVQFAIPQSISVPEVRRIENVFRGITEGEFTERKSESIFMGVAPSEIDLTRPPFDGIGPFSRRVGDKEYLLGQELPVGPVTISIEKAELADPNVIRQIRKGSTQPMNVRFEVLDNQIIHRFESYVRQPRKRLTQRLHRFKQELAREEPQELVDLVTEPLQRDVSSEEAHQIAVGWQFYSHLPDRFCPQDPEIDPATGQWRVPVWLVYTGGEGGPVGEIIIDQKTGKIISHTPIEELYSKGMAIAEKILHA